MKTETENADTRRRDAAKRALEEAAHRRQENIKSQLPPEKGGPEGPEPTRYGDWEKKGIVTDF
ncbi:MAG: succinate dehydrogenase assembly factor 4 [Pseudomonadota bacterium]|nr:succinate dehydrogenase assembly factor 4 [Pseudomonadota bacterium]